jgi:hypothetical protein
VAGVTYSAKLPPAKDLMDRRVPILLVLSLAGAACGKAEWTLEDPDGVTGPSAGMPDLPGEPQDVHAPGASMPGASDGGTSPAAPTYKRIYHVRMTGSDTAVGSAAAPFKTLMKAIRALRPGEAAYVYGGTYTERLDLYDGVVDGTAALPITLKAAPGETPIIKGGTGSSGTMLAVSRAYWILDGLTIDVGGSSTG